MTPDEVRNIRDHGSVSSGEIRKLAESWLRLWDDVARLEHEAEERHLGVVSKQEKRMKAVSTIREQITKLEQIAYNDALPEHIRQQAYEACHALRWVIDDSYWVPATVFAERIQAMGKQSTIPGE